MNRKEAISWVWSVIMGLLASQTNTLADLVSAALSVERVSLGEIGRRMSIAAKHGIKRCWRFTCNALSEPSDAMRGVIRQMLKAKRWRKKPAVIALDWVEVRNFHTLVAALVRKGRAIPLLWARYPEWAD